MTDRPGGGPVFLRWPVVAYALFVNAGAFKDDPRLLRLGLGGALDVTVLLGLLAAGGVGWGWLRGWYRFRRPPAAYLVPAVVLWTLACTSYLWTPAPIYGQEKVLRFLVLTGFSLAAPWLLVSDQASLRGLLGTWVVLAAAMVLDAAGGLRAGVGHFVQAFGSSGYLGLANVSAQALLILVFSSWWTRGHPGRVTLVGILALATAFGVLVSGGRTSAVVVGLTLVAMVGLRLVPATVALIREGRPRAEEVRLLRVVGFSGVGVAVMAIVLGGFFLQFAGRMQRLLAQGQELEWERIALTPAALEAMSSKPWGVGVGGFAHYYYLQDAERGFPHDVVLEFGSELGFLGAASYLLLAGAAAWGGWRMVRRARGEVLELGFTLLALLTFQFTYFLFHGDFNDARSVFTWIGTLFAFRYLLKAPEGAPWTPTTS